LQNEIADTKISDDILKTTKEKFDRNFQTARFMNLRPDSWVNIDAMEKGKFIEKIQEL
jgi:hypothetical protein